MQSMKNDTFKVALFSKGQYLLFVILMSVIVFQETFGMQIEFVSEEIELTPCDSTCTVNGLYWFKNVSLNSVKNSLFYPFVVTEQLPYPDTIAVVDVQSGRQVAFTRSKNGIYFGVTIPSFSTVLYRISYTQKTTACSMHYILRTAARWGKPLEQVIYRVRIPQKYVLTCSTIEFLHMYERNNEQVYETCEENFMPSTDFIIQWERRIP
jgi:hypothetical protein